MISYFLIIWPVLEIVSIIYFFYKKNTKTTLSSLKAIIIVINLVIIFGLLIYRLNYTSFALAILQLYFSIDLFYGQNFQKLISKYYIRSFVGFIIFYCALSLIYLFNISYAFYLSYIILVDLAYIYYSEIRLIRQTTLQASQSLSDSSLPTVTVAIPARNETTSLNDCLLSIVQNDYPKLEILVYDDQSDNPKTSQIIKSFAQDGVIFMPGSSAPDGWLAKNWALQQLTERANGQYLIFCSANLRLDIQAVRHLISLTIKEHYNLLSVIPCNTLQKKFLINLHQPLRYAFEILMPLRLTKKYPGLSSCLVIKKDDLLEIDSFNNLSQSINIANDLANEILKHKNNKYGFIRLPDIMSNKNNQELSETSTRLNFAKLNYSILTTGIYCLLLLAVGFWQYYELIWAIFNFNTGLIIVGLINLGLLYLINYSLLKFTYPKVSKKYQLYYLSLILPLAEIYFINSSMLSYLNKTVYWRKRPVGDVQII